MEDDPDDMGDNYCETIGADTFVVPRLSSEEFADDAAVDATVERLNHLDEVMAERGIDLLYRNQN